MQKLTAKLLLLFVVLFTVTATLGYYADKHKAASEASVTTQQS